MHIELDDIILNKSSVIERSLNRVVEEFENNPELDNYTHIDAMVLNLERSCQAAIDLAQHLVAINHLGVPQNSGDSFNLLCKSEIITNKISKELIAMTGFRNIAVHEYQQLDMGILKYIAQQGYVTLVNYLKELGINIEVKNI